MKQGTNLHVYTWSSTVRLGGFAPARPPRRTAAIIFLYIYIYPFERRALNLLRASFSPIFQYFSAVNDTRVSFSPIFHFNIS